ncbi:hypothetical protein ACFVT5_20975 [Streptomyces sp. NPDC058001]|uniref:hypothetical protein n=1 Tax=Streptomyces sp. NPDC058001 TaxID=3346300 RepID=UPI0036E847EB
MAMVSTDCATDCGFCGSPLQRKTGPGRRREYCDKTCRRRAQRRREQERSSATALTLPQGADLAGELRALSARLAELEGRRAPLASLLECARLIDLTVTGYVGAAVHDARQRGTDWTSIADAADVSVQAARCRWNDTVLLALIGQRRPTQWHPSAWHSVPPPNSGSRAAASPDALPAHAPPSGGPSSGGPSSGTGGTRPTGRA